MCFHFHLFGLGKAEEAKVSIEESIEDSAWYHDNVDRVKLSELLKNDGDFLVRSKQDGSGKVLSVQWKGTKNLVLKENDAGLYRLQSESFSSISALLKYHYENAVIVQRASGALLLNPICRQLPDKDCQQTDSKY